MVVWHPHQVPCLFQPCWTRIDASTRLAQDRLYSYDPDVSFQTASGFRERWCGTLISIGIIRRTKLYDGHVTITWLLI
jgi:hypothetical protein